ncbi:MAG TPA: AMIN domain-containing protein, partial [Leptolyngbya sp.]|nr:AMIN domain-containing protein [Leptolyngbya sp.]
MKELRAIMATAATLALISSQPAFANPTQVTKVQVNPSGAGFDIVLQTQGGKSPQVFNVNRGNTWNAYVFNAQIAQPFRQSNPAPGISQISVIPSGANGVQVTVVGASAAPIGQIASRNAQGVIFNVSSAAASGVRVAPASGGTATPPPSAIALPPAMPSTPLPPNSVAQAMPNSTTPIAPFVPSAQVPNQGQPNVPVAPTPPLMRRAVAPPVGDQAVSQIDTSPTTIDLGTNERIPRLVLRDAPVREVLSLLARAAKLNLAYTDPSNEGQGQQAQQGSKPAAGVTVSIDIENEAVQDVFNYVLRISGLEANRVGRTIFVGSHLPDDARNLVSRTVRLNQVSSDEAAKFLSAQGAVSGGTSVTKVTEVSNTNQTSAGGTTQQQSATTSEVKPNGAPQILTGLLITTGGRLNTLTLTGTPRKVEIATRFLGQLDARKRQVSISVKIVDVNLLKTEDFNTSFSFGIGNNFFNVDQGAAVFNFGQYRPPTNGEASGSLASRPVIQNPYSGSNTFINLDGSVTVPNTAPGLRVIDNGNVVQDVPNGDGTFFTRSVRIQNPFQPGITDVTPATPSVTTITTDPTTGARTASFAAGTLGAVTSALPSLFQFPTQFLARLQSQVTSGNAKILASP